MISRQWLPSNFKTFCRHFFRVAADACLLSVTLLSTLGYQILQSSFPSRARQLFWGSFFIYSILDIFYAFCSSPQSFCSAYMLSFFVIKFLVTFGILVILNINVDRLQSELLDTPIHLHYLIFPKIKLYRSLRFAIAIFLSLPIFYIIINVTVLSWYTHTVITALLEETMFFVLAIYLFLLFFPSERTNLSFFRYLCDRNHVLEFWKNEPHTHEVREEVDGNQPEQEDQIHSPPPAGPPLRQESEDPPRLSSAPISATPDAPRSERSQLEDTNYGNYLAFVEPDIEDEVDDADNLKMN